MPHLIKSKYNRTYHIPEVLRLVWANARNAKGHLNGKPSPCRFQIRNCMVTFNKNRDDTKRYIREITPEQSETLENMHINLVRLQEQLNTLIKEYDVKCEEFFENGRPVPVDELIKEVADGTSASN